MKEATGELNMTVITVVAIAAVGLLFTLFVWPNIQSNLAIQTACANLDAKGGYTTAAGGYESGSDSNGFVTCTNFSCTAYYNGNTFNGNCR